MPIQLQITEGTVRGQRIRVTVEADLAGVEDCGKDPNTGEHVYRLRDLPDIADPQTREGINRILAYYALRVREALAELDDVALPYGISLHGARLKIITDAEGEPQT